MNWRLQQPEVHFDVRSHDNRFAVLQAGLEAPLVDRFDRLLIEAQTDSLHHTQIARMSGLVDFNVENYGARVFCFAGFFRVFRIDLVQDGRLADSAADAVDAATNTATFTRSKARALPRSDATTRSGSD